MTVKTGSIIKLTPLYLFLLWLVPGLAAAQQLYIDFETNTYEIGSSTVSQADLNIQNSTTRTWFDGGQIMTGASNTPAFVDGALLARPAATQLAPQPTDPTTWRLAGGLSVVASSSKTYSNLIGHVLTSAGNTGADARPDPAFAIQPTAGDTYMMSVIYELGSSGAIEVEIRDGQHGRQSDLRLLVPGAPIVRSSDAGVISDYFDVVLEGDLRLLTLLFTAASSSNNYAFGIGPDGGAGENVIVYGANIWEGATTHDFSTFAGLRGAETLSPDLPTGVYDFFVVGGDGKEELRAGVNWTLGDSITPPHDSPSIKRVYAWTAGTAPVSAPPAPGFDIYVLAGQSNMAGRFGPADHENLDIPDRSIFYIPGDDGNTVGLGGSVVGGRVYPAIDPLVHNSISGQQLHVGPGTAFARAIRAATHPNRDILLLATAEGGTGLIGADAPWNPDGSTGDGAVLYNRMIADISAALALSPNNELKAVYWSQGETDAGSGSQTTYPPVFADLVTQTRIDSGVADLPFVISGPLPERASYDNLRLAQASLDADSGQSEALSQVRYVASPAGYDGGDNIHFSAAGHRIRGTQAAEALIATDWIAYATSTVISAGNGSGGNGDDDDDGGIGSNQDDDDVIAQILELIALTNAVQAQLDDILVIQAQLVAEYLD